MPGTRSLTVAKGHLTSPTSGALSNKGMKLTRPGELRSLAAYPRCSPDERKLLRARPWISLSKTERQPCATDSRRGWPAERTNGMFRSWRNRGAAPTAYGTTSGLPGSTRRTQNLAHRLGQAGLFRWQHSAAEFSSTRGFRSLRSCRAGPLTGSGYGELATEYKVVRKCRAGEQGDEADER